VGHISAHSLVDEQENEGRTGSRGAEEHAGPTGPRRGAEALLTPLVDVFFFLEAVGRLTAWHLHLQGA